MTADELLPEIYFDWLRQEAFHARSNRTTYEGVLRVLHDIPFIWTHWMDENRVGDALSFRQYEFLSFQTDLDDLDRIWLGQWATATPTALEVLLGIARRWCYYFGGDVHYYFGHLWRNLGLEHFPGKRLSSSAQESVRLKIDNWMMRQFDSDGFGSPFPLNNPEGRDSREIDIWGQMNLYSAEHFQ